MSTPDEIASTHAANSATMPAGEPRSVEVLAREESPEEVARRQADNMRVLILTEAKLIAKQIAQGQRLEDLIEDRRRTKAHLSTIEREIEKLRPSRKT